MENPIKSNTINQKRRWRLRQHYPAKAVQINNLVTETRWLLAYSLFYVLLAVLIGFAIRSFPLPLLGATYFTQDFWYVVVFKIGFLLILPVAVFRRWGYSFNDVFFGWKASTRSILTILVLFLIGLFVNSGRTAEIADAMNLHSAEVAIARIALGFFIALFFAGIPEELFYRGMLQTRLEALWGSIPAIITSALLFVAWHIPTRYILAHSVEGEAGDLMSVLVGTGLPVTIVALIFALAWARYRNLPALMAIHTGIDTLPVVASMLQSTAPSIR